MKINYKSFDGTMKEMEYPFKSEKSFLEQEYEEGNLSLAIMDLKTGKIENKGNLNPKFRKDEDISRP